MPTDLRSTGHRPYPLPRSPWAMAMVWHELLFMHWPVPTALLRPLIPAPLAVDTYTGGPFTDQAFIGVVPFRMSGVRARATPPLPMTSAFPELNVRTYVRGAAPAGRADAEPRGRPGVWFFSLDAASRLAVEVARVTFHLPYLFARMRCSAEPADPSDPKGDPWVSYTSIRRDRRGGAADFIARYRPNGPAALAAAGTLESFLTDRYCLYAAGPRGRILRGEIHHAPWPLCPAEVRTEVNTMAAPLGIALPPEGPWPMLHYVERLDVRAWLPRGVPAAAHGDAPPA